jgi:hypothetical protein
MKKILLLFRKIFLGSPWRKRFFFSVLGAVGGYAYYYYIGCLSGTCPISSNPWISTSYGAIIGLLLAASGKKPSQTTS